MIKTKKGFTLVELLVVIAIIGMLSTIAVVSLDSARKKARDAKRIADMRQVSAALEIYYSDQSGYPAAATSTTLNNMSICSTSGVSASCGGTSYMANVPAYPNPPVTAACTTTAVANYCYTSTATTSYTITYQIENQSDFPGATGTHCKMDPTGTSCNATN